MLTQTNEFILEEKASRARRWLGWLLWGLQVLGSSTES